jgi:hypothetical protein
MTLQSCLAENRRARTGLAMWFARALLATIVLTLTYAAPSAVTIINVSTPEELQKAVNNKNELSVPAHVVIQDHLDLRNLASAANASANEIMDGGKRNITVRVRSALYNNFAAVATFECILTCQIRRIRLLLTSA